MRARNGLRLYVGTHEGVTTLTSGDGAEPWRQSAKKGLDHAAARFAPSASLHGRAYLAAYEAGMWRTDDGGQNWTALESYPSPYAHSVAVHPTDPNRLYVGSEPATVYLSEDGGQNWQECSSFKIVPEAEGWWFFGDRAAHVRDLRIAPDDPQTIYAGIEVGGVVISRDGGKTWIQSAGTDPDVHLLHVAPAMPSRVYVVTQDGPYRSDDSGRTWTHLTNGLERLYSVAVISAPDDPDRVLVAVASNAGRKGAQAYLSLNGGNDWQKLDLSTEEDMVVAFAWDPGDTKRVIGGTDGGRIFESDDGGRNWKGTVEFPAVAVGALEIVSLS